ncbi:hypothetical protein ABZT04_30865 [Streptomyces sp. NPDC005492]|uniref:hypothetical protein n=1 Tax=Streptomyces sp. NPDC005492 TaxID=3156883 RepID=UPI0033B6CB23
MGRRGVARRRHGQRHLQQLGHRRRFGRREDAPAGAPSTSYLCDATTGYDGPTGPGTPNGLGVDSSLCGDDRSSDTANLDPIQMWNCNGSSAQVWHLSS